MTATWPASGFPAIEALLVSVSSVKPIVTEVRSSGVHACANSGRAVFVIFRELPQAHR
jgi:hypothetical protein